MTTLTITNGATATGAPGSTLQLIAEVRDGGGVLHPEYNPIWSTSNGAVATVDATGLMRFWAAGTSVVSATLAAFGLADSINVTVSGSAMLTALNGDVLTFDGSVWNPANPNTRFVLRGGDTVVGVYTFSDTTQSTSVATGGVVLAGGLGIAKNLWVGGTLNVAGISTLASVLGTSITGSVYVAVSSGVDVWGMAATATSLTLRKVGVADYIQMTATAFTPYAASGMTLGTAALPWGAVYGAAASFTTGEFSGVLTSTAGLNAITINNAGANQANALIQNTAGSFEVGVFASGKSYLGSTSLDDFELYAHNTKIATLNATQFIVGASAFVVTAATGAVFASGSITTNAGIIAAQGIASPYMEGNSVSDISYKFRLQAVYSGTATMQLFSRTDLILSAGGIDGTKLYGAGAALGLTIAPTTGAATFASSLAITGALTGVTDLSMGQQLLQTVASGSSVGHGLAQTGVVRWDITNTATSGLFAISESGVANWLTIAKTTGTVTFAGAVTAGAASFTTGAFSGDVNVGAGKFVVTAATGAVAISGTITSTVAATASSSAFYVNSTSPSYAWRVSGSAADEKLWDIVGGSTTLQFRAVNDAINATNVWLTATRSGIASVAVSLSGSLAITGALTGVTTLTASGVVTLNGVGNPLQISTTGTGAQYGKVNNGTGVLFWGVENSTGGGLFTSAPAYAGAIGTEGAYALVLATNNTTRVTIASGGGVTIASLAGVGTRAVVVDANGVLSAP